MAKKTIDQLDVKGRRIFVRADFNVPQDDDGRITDDRRIQSTLPTLLSVLKRGGSVVAASHLGRPEGKGFEKAFSMAPVAERLQALLGSAASSVRLVGQQPTDVDAAAAAAVLKPGEVLLLENLRFEKGEKKGDAAFAGKLAAYADAYCNDAFGASHRNDASMLALPQAMKPKPCVAGLLLARELKFLGDTIARPPKPFVAILGGAKVSDKLPALRHLIGRVDAIVVGGAMAYTFLLAQGKPVGRSLVQRDLVNEAKAVLQEAPAKGTRLLLPVDHVCGQSLEEGTPTQVHAGIPEDWMGLDIGPATEAAFAGEIAKARLVVWNGPMGAFEIPPFDHGTRAMGQAVAAATRAGCITIAGGGDTAAAVEIAGLAEALTHISTGGGASLEMLEGKVFDSLGPLEDSAG
ncbi:MAG: phosphoglycerate kinase [Planctomycetes bacterium]|nr:phosphoglycerate kinase [Planctomycetota bacterium]